MLPKLPFALAVVLCFNVLTASSFASAEETPADPYAANLFGDLGGIRSALDEHGITLTTVAVTDYGAVLDGGLKKNDTFLYDFDMIANVDFEKAGLWKGGKLFTYVLATGGSPLTALEGDLQISSNIEAPESIKLLEAWYEQTLFDGSLSLLAGLHDYNSEFDVLKSTTTLLNTSFTIGPDILQALPSTFPTTALGVRVRVVPYEETYVQAAVYDGVPGSPNNPRGTHIILDEDDGLFWGVEGGTANEPGAGYLKAAVGMWYSTTDSVNVDGEESDRNYGFYGITEKRLYSEAADPEQGLNGFFSLGFTRESTNFIGQYLGAGFAYTGVIEGRDADILALGVAHARLSSDVLRVDDTLTEAETAVEVNYRVAVTDYFAVTPDLQYVVNPGASTTVHDALVGILRAELSF